jgi:creatinine amidohydrolase
MDKVRYAEMLPHEILERRRCFPAAFVPLGGLEWHGEHLAVGNDALKAERLCELAAGRSGGFAFPPVWYGEPRIAGGSLLEADYDIDGAVTDFMGLDSDRFLPDQYGCLPDEQVAFYQRLLRHVLLQLNALSMRAVCLVCGHYPLHSWAVPVVEAFNREERGTLAFAGIEYHYPTPQTELVGGDHAAKWETSYLWYLRPECVDLSVFRGREQEPLLGVYGDDPRTDASKESGRVACDLIVTGMVRKAQDLLASTADPGGKP